MSVLLECKAVCKEYRQGELRVLALQGISFFLEKGEAVCIVGRSGSGKTTLLNCIGGLDRPTFGEIILEGKPIQNFSEKNRLAIRRKKFSFIFQESHLFPFLSILDNVALPLVYRGESWKSARQKAYLLLEQVGLSKRVHQKARWLSGGEAQRTAIARALISEPDLLLADEPTAQLDNATSREIIRLLFLQKQAGRTLLVATHDPVVEKNADRALHLEDGKLLANP
jgi:ABC-type lipoprotein export system ATPase subunit